MSVRYAIGAALCFALAFVAPQVAAQQDANDNSPVATVNGEAVLRSDALKAAESLPQQYQSQIEQLFPLLVQRAIDLRLIGLAAADSGLAEDEEVTERLAEQKLDIMREVYLERQIDDRITDARLRTRYKAFLTENPPKAEISARHILVESEEDARKLIEELNGGADFTELAREHSTGPSSVQGGDLGYFTEEQMVPEFATAAFGMEAGTYSADPVQTQFGWHVVRVEDHRLQEAPAFEEVQDQMQEEVRREALAEAVAELREGAAIEILEAAEQQ